MYILDVVIMTKRIDDYDYNGCLMYSVWQKKKERTDIVIKCGTIPIEKENSLRYYLCTGFDGKILTVKRLRSLPQTMAFADKLHKNNNWYVHNLDILKEKYKILEQKED